MSKDFGWEAPTAVGHGLESDSITTTATGPISVMVVDTEVPEMIMKIYVTMRNDRDRKLLLPGGYKREKELENLVHLKSGDIHQE